MVDVDVATVVEGRLWARPLVAAAGLLGAVLMEGSLRWRVDMRRL